jgi:hypothetical protein
MVMENQNEKKFLSKLDVVNADDRKPIELYIPEWNGYVKIKHMSGAERDKWESSNKRKDGSFDYNNFRARLAVLTLLDENNQPMFTPAEISDLGKKTGVALDRIFTVILETNKITEKDVEDMAKNS